MGKDVKKLQELIDSLEKAKGEEDKKKDIADFYCIDYLELLR